MCIHLCAASSSYPAHISSATCKLRPTSCNSLASRFYGSDCEQRNYAYMQYDEEQPPVRSRNFLYFHFIIIYMSHWRDLSPSALSRLAISRCPITDVSALSYGRCKSEDCKTTAGIILNLILALLIIKANIKFDMLPCVGIVACVL